MKSISLFSSHSFFDIFSISRRFIHVWQRNIKVYQKTWLITFLPPLLEPLFYLLAFGFGLSIMIGKIHYSGQEISYSQFIAPAIVAINIMYNAFFENTFSSFVRMYYQKTFDAMMATPLSLSDIIAGEIFWGATKSVMATSLVMGVLSLFGLLCYPHSLLLLPLALLGGVGFGSLAMFFTGLVPSIEVFNLPIFLFITPMFLFSNTFFPIKNLPAWAQTISSYLPLAHLVNLARSISLGSIKVPLLWDIGYLVIFNLIFFPLALLTMHRRLIR